MLDDPSILRVFAGGVLLLKFIWDLSRFRVRGRGSTDVGLLRLLANTVIIGGVLWSIDSPNIPGDVGVLRGGATRGEPTRIQKKNPAFRMRKNDGSKYRVLLEKMKADYKEPPVFRALIKGAEKPMTVEELETQLKAHFRTWVILVDYDRNETFNPQVLWELLNIEDRINEEKILFDDENMLIMMPGRDGYMNLRTEGGTPYEIRDEEVVLWLDVQQYMKKKIQITDGVEFRKTFSLEALYEHIDTVLEKLDIKVQSPEDNQFQVLSQNDLKRLLEYENRMQVAWEDQWVTVSNNLFEFMKNRIEPSAGSIAPSLRRFAAPAGFDPVKLNQDGLFLVTPAMETLENERSIDGNELFSGEIGA